MMKSRERGTLGSKVKYADDDFFNQLPLQESEVMMGEQQVQDQEDMFEHLEEDPIMWEYRAASITRTNALNSKDQFQMHQESEME